MCGIAGIVGESIPEGALARMIESQKHRGPDGRGESYGRGVALGHNRLAILDLSSVADQPMRDRTERFTLVFNGEIYNYRELKEQLRGYPFQGTGDSEVLLAAYIKWGYSCVDRFIGMFSFAIWDDLERKLFCARDRLGIKPFHYSWYCGNFFFASEVKTILSAGVRVEANWRAWKDYWNHGLSDHTDETFFSNVYQLPPGHTLILSADQKISLSEYWNLPDKINESAGNNSQFDVDYLDHLVGDAIRLRLRSDVPIGVNLSGGLDSGTLFRFVTELKEPAQIIKSFTGCFVDEAYDEGSFASLVNTEETWSRHFEIFKSNQAWKIFEEMVRIQEAPFGGVGSALRYVLAKRIQREGIKVILQAEGVDELFAGYANYLPFFLLDAAKDHKFSDLRASLREEDRRTIFKRLRSVSENPFGEYQDGTDFRQPEGTLNDGFKTDMPDIPRPFSSHLRNRQFQDLKQLKLPRVLRINDRLSMACGLEFREPFLDHRLVEYAFGLASNAKIKDHSSKYAIRLMMRERLPETVRLEPKRPVVTPQREWLRDQLRPEVEQLIHDQRFVERGVFDPKHVQTHYKNYVENHSENSFFVWQWINSELWFREFIDL